jgi:hypothetical protein
LLAVLDIFSGLAAIADSPVFRSETLDAGNRQGGRSILFTRSRKCYRSPTATREGHYESRNTWAGSVRVARQAGKRQAAIAVIVIAPNANPKASGSCGLTL